ncbi:hypothetical protein ABZ845_21395 [Streptomyces sp. NPDC047022]|uniref:hypothetical protein n=1 Tax=Streptomyces sp. NPDC047022 TaxID=3155737 RepID=UPI0033E63946
MSGPLTPKSHPSSDTASDVIRWAAFCCVLVPVVLVWYGISPAAAISAGLGLTTVTTACRALLRHSEREAARLKAEESDPPRGAHDEAWTGARRGGCHTGGNTPVD